VSGRSLRFSARDHAFLAALGAILAAAGNWLALRAARTPWRRDR
jgi:hypothetical protein